MTSATDQGIQTGGYGNCNMLYSKACVYNTLYACHGSIFIRGVPFVGELLREEPLKSSCDRSRIATSWWPVLMRGRSVAPGPKSKRQNRGQEKIGVSFVKKGELAGWE